MTDAPEKCVRNDCSGIMNRVPEREYWPVEKAWECPKCGAKRSKAFPARRKEPDLIPVRVNL